MVKVVQVNKMNNKWNRWTPEWCRMCVTYWSHLEVRVDSFVEERGWKDACLKGFNNRKERSRNCCGDWGKCEEKWKHSWIFFSNLSGYGYGFIIQQTPTIKQHPHRYLGCRPWCDGDGRWFWCRVKNIVDGEEYCIGWVWADGDFLPNIIDRLGIHVYLANGRVNGLLIGSLMRRRGRGRVHKEGVYDSMGPVVILCGYVDQSQERMVGNVTNQGRCEWLEIFPDSWSCGCVVEDPHSEAHIVCTSLKTRAPPQYSLLLRDVWLDEWVYPMPELDDWLVRHAQRW